MRQTWSCSLTITVLCSVAAALVASPRAARAEVSSSGTYRTQVSIEVPAFRGLEPRIALVYDSAAGNGSAGVGWRLAAGSTISRVGPGRGAPGFNGDDRFLLDGQELITCPPGSLSPSCTTGGTHVGRIDSFQRIKAEINDTWTITDRDGRRSIYSPQLRASAGPYSTYRWVLTRVEDTHGNSVTYDWNCGGGAQECVLTAIRYGSGKYCGSGLPDTQPGTLIAAGEVLFHYSGRADAPLIGTGDHLISSPHLLRTIEVRSAGRLQRAYALDYVTSQATGASLLHQVQEYGADAQLDPNRIVVGGSHLPPTIVETRSMSQGNQGWASSTISLPSWANALITGTLPGPEYDWKRSDSEDWMGQGTMRLRWTPGDVNGDGLTDYVLIGGIQLGVALARRDGTFEFLVDNFANTAWIGTTHVDPTANVHSYIADFDGDGRGDFMQALDAYYCDSQCPCQFLSSVCKHTAFRVARYQDDGTWEYSQHTTPWPYEGNRTISASIGWNISLTIPIGPVSASTSLSSGTIWRSSSTWLNDNWFVGDYDGDGRYEFLGISRVDRPSPSGSGTFKGVRLRAVRPDFGSAPPPEVITDTDWDWGDNHSANSRFFIGDVDGDLRSDFMVAHYIPAQGSTGPRLGFAVGRSNGDGTFTPSLQVTNRVWATEDVWLPADGDGDGRTDFIHVQYKPNTNPINFPHATVETAFSDGEGNFTFGNSLEVPERWHFPIPCVGTWEPTPWMIADVDGDGRSDVVHPSVNHDYNCLTEDSHYVHARVIYSRPGGNHSYDPAQTPIGGGGYLPECGQELAMATGEFNGDGREDFLYANSIRSTDQGCLLRPWRLEVTPSPRTTADAYNWTPSDLNGDGREDLYYVLYTNPGYRVYTLIAQPGGGYARSQQDIGPLAPLVGLDQPGASRWIAIDVGSAGPGGEPDGLADLVLVDYDRDLERLLVTTLFSVGNGQFIARQQAHANAAPVEAGVDRWGAGDFDGDGRGDFYHVASTAPGHRVDLLRSNGDGTWTWSNQVHFVGVSWPEAQQWRVLDANGDGKSDLVLPRSGGTTTTVAVLLSRPGGGFREVLESLPVPRREARLWRSAELNGDGLGDLVLVEEQRGSPNQAVVHSLLSEGDGTFAYAASAPQSLGVRAAHDRHNFRIVDLNQDGRSDLVHVGLTRVSGLLFTGVISLMNEHDGWNAHVQNSTLFIFTDVPSWRPMDLDADGTPELLYVTSDLHQLELEIGHDRLISEQNGIGGELAVSYKSSAGSHAYMPGGPFPVVDQIDVLEHVVAGGVVERERYSYAGARWSAARRSFLGFASITRSDGLAVGITRYSQSDQCGVRPTALETRDNLGWLFGSQHFSYVNPSPTGQAPFVCLPWVEEGFECERSAPCRLMRAIHEYDEWGNEVRTYELGDAVDKSDDRMIESPVNANRSAFIVSLPAYRSVSESDGAGGWRLLASTRHYYDGATQNHVAPTRGELSASERWDDSSGGWVRHDFAYDARGNLVRATGPATQHAPAGTWETTDYDCSFALYPVRRCNARFCEERTIDLTLGAVDSATDANGQVTIVDYDPLGRVTRMTMADGSFIEQVPPPASTWGTPAQAVIEKHSDESPGDGVLWRQVHQDGLGRPVRVITEEGSTTLVEYDGASERPRRTSAPFGPFETPEWTQYFYDALGRQTTLVHPDGARQITSYEPATVWRRDEVGGTVGVRVDGFGRTREVIEVLMSCPPGQMECAGRQLVTSYRHDGLDRLVGVVDALGNKSHVEWDSLGGKRRQCDPDSGCWSYDYNPDGTLARQTDANGEAIAFRYDELGRPVEKQYYDAGGNQNRTVSYHWDRDPTTGAPAGASIGRRVLVEDRGGGVDIDSAVEYDVLGRETLATRCLDGRCMQWATEFDLGGRVERITYPDARGRVSKGSEVVEYVYGESGRLAAMPGFIDEIWYDGAGRPTGIELASGALTLNRWDRKRSFLSSTEVLDVWGGTVLRIDYGYDAKGRVKRQQSDNAAVVTADYFYDSLDRLTVVQSSDRAHEREFQYDEIGNITFDKRYGSYHRQDRAHVHAVTATDAGHFREYDARGNLTASERLRLGWNQDGMPTWIEDRRNGTRGDYAYDDDGQRVKKQTKNGTSYYYSPLIEIDERGDVVTTYVAGSLRVARRNRQGLAFYHDDLLGSVRMMTDDRSWVQNRYDYGAYGDEVSVFEPLDNEIGFAGERDDDESRLTYMNARYYDSELGVFISADTVVPGTYDPQALNRYAYAFNSPTNYSDPSGHAPAKASDRPMVLRDIYGNTIGTLYPRGAGKIGELVPPGAKRVGNKPRPADPTREWAQWEAPLSPPPLVEAVNLDAVLAQGREETIRKVVVPCFGVIGIGLGIGAAVGTAVVAAPVVAAGATSVAAGAESLAVSTTVLRGSMALHGAGRAALGWYLRTAASPAGQTAIKFAAGMNVFNQGMEYMENPDDFQFDNGSLAFDMVTAPLGPGVARSVFGKFPLFAKGERVTRFGRSLPKWSHWTDIVDGQLAFASYVAAMSVVRAYATDTPLGANLEAGAKRFPAGAAQAIGLEYLVAVLPGQFPGGREGRAYALMSRGTSLAIGYFMRPPTRNSANKEKK